MKLLKLLGSLVLVMLLEVTGSALGATYKPENHTIQYLPTEIIVKYKACSNTNVGRNLEAFLPLKLGKILKSVRKSFNINGLWHIYEINPGSEVNIRDICSELMKRPEIEYAEPNYWGHFCDITPNDPNFPLQWYLKNTGQIGGPIGIDVDATEAWDLNTGNEQIVVAVIDTGVDYTHPDLASNIWHNPGETPDDGIDNDGNGHVDDIIGWDFVSVPDSWVATGEDPGPEDNDPLDRTGHGTYCAGVISSIGNNGVGTCGITWRCKIMPVRIGFMRPDGTSYFLASDAARGIRYAADNGADVINLSWIIRSAPNVVKEAIEYARSKGVTIVGAVGNDDALGPVFPSTLPQVIAVASTNNYDERALWKHPQPPLPGEGSNFGLGIDVAAPGIDILTTAPDSGYISVSGTSISSALTSGLAALILSEHPDFGPDEVHDAICSSSDSPLLSDKFIGHGRIDAFKALLITDVPFADIISPEDNTMLSGEITITGTARGRTYNLANCTIEYGKGIYPNEWTQIADFSTPVENGALATWNTDETGNGEYTLRLTVYDSEGNYNTKEKIVFVNKGIHPGWPIETGGEIVAHPVVGNLDGDGSKEIVAGSKDGQLYAWKSNGDAVFGKTLEGNILSTPVLADINQDGRLEILVATDDEFNTPSARIYLLNYDGSPVDGWPKEFTEGNCFAISAGDLDGDADLEIVVGFPVYEKGTLYVWNHDSSNYAGWPVESGDDYTVHSVAGDIDNDGSVEIVGTKKNGTLLIWNRDGSPFMTSKWPKTFSGALSSPVLADLDGNGDLEIIVACNTGHVYAYHHDGTKVSGWPSNIDIPIGSGTWAPPAVGDADSDGFPEVIAAGGSNNRIYIWHSDGSALDGWPRMLPASSFTTPVIGDVDNDGKVEMLTTCLNLCILWDLPGDYTRPTMQWPMFQHDRLHSGVYRASCQADTDNDGEIDGEDLALFAINAGVRPNVPEIASAFGCTGCPTIP